MVPKVGSISFANAREHPSTAAGAPTRTVMLASANGAVKGPYANHMGLRRHDPHDEIGPPMGYAGILALAGRLTRSAGLATVYAPYLCVDRRDDQDDPD